MVGACNIMISGFMVVLDSTIVNTALPKIMASFGISVDVAQWILTGYMLAFAVMLPCSGWIADRFGYKRTYAVGLPYSRCFPFSAAYRGTSTRSSLCASVKAWAAVFCSPSAWRSSCGNSRRKSAALPWGFWSISAAASVSLGPLFGGYIADNFDWHLIFNINIPVGIICFFATWVIQREYKTQHARSFDMAGFLSLSVSWASCSLPLRAATRNGTRADGRRT